MTNVRLPDVEASAARSKNVLSRVMAANRQEAVGEVHPVVWASEPFLSGYAHIGRQDYYASAEEKYFAQAKFQLDFPDILHLPGVAPDFGYAPETSAWGSPIKREEDGPLVPFAAVNDIHDLPELNKPDPWSSGYMAIALRDICVVRRAYGFTHWSGVGAFSRIWPMHGCRIGSSGPWV